MKSIILFLVFWPFIAALVSFAIGRKNVKGRDLFASIAAALEMAGALLLAFNWYALGGRLTAADGVVTLTGLVGMGLTFGLDSFRLLYVIVASFMWLVSTIFSTEYMAHYRNRNRYYFFMLLTLGSTVGVFLSADFFTMFLFFEIMSLASYVWVAQDEKKAAMRAAETYLAIAVIGGLFVLMGLFLLYNVTGDLSTMGSLKGCYDNLATASDRKKVLWAGICMLVGFGAKAGLVPLHIWLPKAHPVAPAPASALLSGILTKTGVFGVMLLTLQIFAGFQMWSNLILVLGVATMVTGAVLALYSIDLKRTLACSSVSQIGFIIVGLGMAGLLQTEADGAVLHMLNHSLIKLALFSVAGVIFMNIHQLDLNQIRGFGRKKLLLNAIFLMGALGIGGIPLFNGYASKTIIHELIVEYSAEYPSFGITLVEWLFIISGGITIAYMSKLYIAIFIEKNEDPGKQQRFEESKQYMKPVTAILLSVTAILLPAIGIGVGIKDRLFSWECLSGAVYSILIGGFLYLVVVRQYMRQDNSYVNRWNSRLDLENMVYRPLLAILEFVVTVVCRFCDRLLDSIIVLLRRTIYRDSPLPYELEEGNVLTHTLGHVLDVTDCEMEKIAHREHDVNRPTYEHRLALLCQKMMENNAMIGRSLSFGLLLFCVGLVITLIYMLLV